MYELSGRGSNDEECAVHESRQFQLLVYACRGGWEVRYHIADYAEKIKMAAVQIRSDSLYL